jgi:hypothetical protein
LDDLEHVFRPRRHGSPVLVEPWRRLFASDVAEPALDLITYSCEILRHQFLCRFVE